MEWRKVKNIIILVLLLVNGFLLVLVGFRKGEARRYEQTALTQAVQALERSGIEVDIHAITPADGLPSLTVERDTVREARMIGALLGETVEGEDRGGGLYLYRGERGEVSLRLGGELSAVLENDLRWRTDAPEGHAADLLQQMAVEARQVQTVRKDGAVQVVFRQQWDGTPIFSCHTVFIYVDGRLTAVQGNLLAFDQAAEEQGTALTLPTALLRFLDYVRSSGDVCSSIQSMEAGYRAVQSFSGTTSLTAVWLVSSNTASYYLDASTGALTRLAEG